MFRVRKYSVKHHGQSFAVRAVTGLAVASNNGPNTEEVAIAQCELYTEKL